ncbi:TDT family transporter [Candidatus Cetobacterium colombiensis]|uniref:TDT family transporter n=1 Tax=Candidatus Cetobacterium colombiensis TaxID=3073100 RepID=A0ABU4WBX5_9FUSO|nr:TDT family transporter [Candidatus Cetobacterium colombiensis]MDX8335993.1 TDT family transporter [Candidatus Cetobacterium colombiensis]
MKNLKNYFKYLPVALTGLALGVSGISGAVAVVLDSRALYVGNFISLMLLLPIIVKNILHFDVFKEELKHPTLGSFIPTLDMALMNFSVVLYKLSPTLGKGLWLLCIFLHLIFGVSFIYHRFRSWNIEHMVPSWFVPPIGVVVASVNSGVMGMPQLAQAIFYIGFAFYIVMLPMMLYRVIFVDKIDDARLPTFAIMAAPPNLCLAGYLVAFETPNPAMVGFLFPLGIFMTALLYISMVKIIRLKFTPVYASFTFPLAIGSTAIIKYSSYIRSIDESRGVFWYNFGVGATTLALFFISIIFIRIVRIVINQIKEIRGSL